MNEEDKDRILLVDKPLGWTSFDVVKKLRGCLKIKKVGHAGTLDPLASGLLIVCTGKMTKKISEIQEMEKEYEGDFTLGQTTPSFDLETEVSHCASYHHLKEKDIIDASKSFIGELKQIPPSFSAVKVMGKRAYLRARKGEDMDMKPRIVYIEDLQIKSIDLPVVTFKVICSKGTYIRSLANDFGKLLGVGAYLSRLVRTRIGQYNLEKAKTIDDICPRL